MIPDRQNSVIWGNGWYAVLHPDDNSDKLDENDVTWYLSPKEYFEKNGSCPDGWEWDIPEGWTSEELNDFIECYGCEPTPPPGFSYVIESGIAYYLNIPIEEQKDILRKYGFIVDDVPKWYWEK